MNLKNFLIENHRGFYFWMLNCRSQLSTLTRASLINKYLSSTAHPKLQLGSGRNYMEGWLNTDFLAKHPRFLYLNVAKPFPLPSSAFERVYSEHMIEHIPLSSGETMLAESFRVLKPGGRIRIETPDLRKISEIYVKRGQEDAEEYIRWHYDGYCDKKYPPTLCFAINNFMRNWGHTFMYDAEMLDMALTKAGFRDIKTYGWNQTDDPEFRNISKREGVAMTAYETFVMEGTKPA